jgi:nucleotide-binding universal stress UspA family protein
MTDQIQFQIPHLSIDGDPNFIPKRTIVLPVYRSKVCLNTIKWTLENIVDPDDLIILLHVRPHVEKSFAIEMTSPYTPMVSLCPEKSCQNIDDIEKRDSFRLLIQYSQLFATQKIHVNPIPLQGDTCTELVAKINELKPSLVVIGNCKLGFVKKLLVGSITDYIMKYSMSPVMVVPCVLEYLCKPK